jgi:hypothetical protein
MSSFETAVANGEEYFELDGIELKRNVCFAGCDESLEIGSDYAAHSAKCEYAQDNLEPGDDITYEVSDSDLLQAYYESQEEDEGCGYDRYRDNLGIEY